MTGRSAPKAIAGAGSQGREGLRLPDFVIIGTMKSGSTSLYRWLTEHPDAAPARRKEPNFFSLDRTWARGLEWYSALFAGAPRAHRTGEASVSYTDPRYTSAAASRMRASAPDVRLICVLRNPLERLRSHYRHEVQRGRERAPFQSAIQRPDNLYVACSRYASCLIPWVESFPRGQLCVVRLEDLIGDDGSTWTRVLEHVGLPEHVRPSEAFNVTSEKEQFTTLMRVLWQWGIVPKGAGLPPLLRRLARRLLLRRSDSYAARFGESRATIPERIADPIWEDVAQLPRLLDDARLRW